MTDEHVYYHVVFTVTYGKPVFLVPEVDAAFKDLVRELSHKQGWLLIEMETMPNHVHLLIEKAPWEDPRQIIKAVKAFTARRPTPPRPPVVATVILRRLAGIQPPCHLRAGSDYARNSIAHPRHTTSPAIGLHAFHTLPGISHRHAAPRVVCAGIGLALRWHWAGAQQPGFAASGIRRPVFIDRAIGPPALPPLFRIFLRHHNL